MAGNLSANADTTHQAPNDNGSIQTSDPTAEPTPEATPEPETTQEPEDEPEAEPELEPEPIFVSPRRGRLTIDGVYTSEYLGLRVVYPSHWNHVINEEYLSWNENTTREANEEWNEPGIDIQVNWGEVIPDEFWIWSDITNTSFTELAPVGSVSPDIMFGISFIKLPPERINSTELDWISPEHEIIENPIRLGNNDWFVYKWSTSYSDGSTESTVNFINYINIYNGVLRRLWLHNFHSMEKLEIEHENIHSWITPYP